MGQTVSRPDGMLSMEELIKDLSSSSSSEEELYSADDETDAEATAKLLPPDEGEGKEEGGSVTEERWWTVGLQVFFPFLVAGFGMVAAGLGTQI
jgi:hypothetical protein